MERWVITGPIGSGKSLLSDVFAAEGAAVIEADRLGHELLRRPDVRTAIAGTFGPGVLAEGAVDRAALGGVVFADPDRLAELNRLVHPHLATAIREAFTELAAASQHPVAVLEAAIYFLLPSVGPIDLTIAVIADAEVRTERLAGSGRLTAAEARRRIVAQATMDRFWPRADVVLVNDGDAAELARAGQRLWNQRWGESA